MHKINRPILKDAPTHCEYFFGLTQEDNLLASLEFSRKLTLDLIRTIPLSKEEYRYAAGKWSVKMVFAHITDCERYYCYYAMYRSRKAKIAIAPLDREVVALNSNAGRRTLSNIAEEYVAV